MDMLVVARVAKLVALFGFFMPWAVISCSGQEMVSMTGVDLVTGQIEAQGQKQNLGLNAFIIVGAVTIVIGLIGSFADNVESERRGAAGRTLLFAVIAAGSIFAGMAWFKDSLRREASEGRRNSASYEQQLNASALAMIKIEEKAGYYTTLFSVVVAAAASGMALGGQQPQQPAPTSTEHSAARPREDDIEDWDRLTNKDDPDQLQEYLLRHPRGRFSELARMKLEKAGVAPIAPTPAPAPAPNAFEPSPAISEQAYTPPTPQTFASADYDEPAPRKRSLALPIFGALLALGAVLAGGYFFIQSQQNAGAANAQAEASDPNQFTVLPYEAGEQLHAKESGSRYRAMPFARPDIPVLGETTEHEALNITGWVEQPEGHWYQLRLADGRTAYLKATLTVSATTLAREAAASPAPPTRDGLYVQRDVCPFEGCAYRRWRATRVTNVYDAPANIPVVTGRVSPNEWVTALTGEVHIAPVQGVAARSAGDVSAGDVGYRLSYLGEGNWSVWHKGRVLNDSYAFTFPNAGDDRGVWWVRVRLADGRLGWIKHANNFACRGEFGGDEGCD